MSTSKNLSILWDSPLFLCTIGRSINSSLTSPTSIRSSLPSEMHACLNFFIPNTMIIFEYVLVHELYPEMFRIKNEWFWQMIPVAINDVAFSIHAVALTAFTLFQIFIYERKNQRFSKISIGIVTAAWLSAAVCVIVAFQRHSWLWLISVFNTIQVIMTVIKYIPQAVMNFRRKSTDGFSIGNILLDLLGGFTNYGQMAVQSIDQKSWVNFYGNIGKTLLSLVSIFFDILFIIQHYVLYPGKKSLLPTASSRSDTQS